MFPPYLFRAVIISSGSIRNPRAHKTPTKNKSLSESRGFSPHSIVFSLSTFPHVFAMAINEIINTVCDGSFYVSSWIELSQDSDIWSNISLDVAMKFFLR